MPRVDLNVAKNIYHKLHAAIQRGLVRACHDLSEGGLAVAAAEMAFAGGLGAQLRLDPVPVPEGEQPNPLVALFDESPSRFLVEVELEMQAEFEAALKGVPCGQIGFVKEEPWLTIDPAGGDERERLAWLIHESLEDLKRAWQGAF